VAQLVELIERLGPKRPRFERLPWPQSEPSRSVSDNSAFTEATGWRPAVSIEDGFSRVQTWVSDEPAALLS
jgi:nucleoside-diphosphate-sugar epimerase